jgi:hypothetical protein
MLTLAHRPLLASVAPVPTVSTNLAPVHPTSAPTPVIAVVPTAASTVLPQTGAIDTNWVATDGTFTFAGDAGNPNTMTIDLSQAVTGPWRTTDGQGHGVYDPSIWAVVFKYQSITVGSGRTIRFQNHASHAPVAWLSLGDVTIVGTVDVSGTLVTQNGTQMYWLEPGPGGFRGGVHNLSMPRRSAGFGPGGGFDPVDSGTPGYILQNGAGGRGNYATSNFSTPATVPQDGSTYGSPTLFPLMGGSGSGSRNEFTGSIYSFGGGPGGGALLIATNSALALQSGALFANGGADFTSGGTGSGGGIRLVCESFLQLAQCEVRAVGRQSVSGSLGSWPGGDGRIRVEANTFLSQPFSIPAAVQGPPGPLFPDSTTPRIAVLSLEYNSTTTAVPSDPRAGTNGSAIDVVVPYTGSATAHVEAFHVAAGRTVTVRITSFYGDAVLHTGTLVQDPGDPTRTTAAVPIVVPVGMSAVQARVVL